MDCINKLYKEGGIQNIYRRRAATLLREAPASGVYFATYEWFKKTLAPEEHSIRELSPLRTLFAGGMAGICNWLVAIPSDVLKSRLQTAPHGKYSGIVDVFRELLHTEGIRALYKGIAPVMLRAFPANGACFLGYEMTVTFLDYLFPKW